MKNDTISRQETLEHLRKRLIETAFNNVGYECDAGKVFEDASKRLDVWLSEVPSAQPEIILCKDCKHRCETEDGEYNPEDIVCAYWMSDGLIETDYCSHAERREE